MPTPDMRVLADPIQLANWRTDTHRTWAELCDAHDKARLILGIREGNRVWDRAGKIIQVRRTRPGCQLGWCNWCARPLYLLDGGRLPAHTQAGKYDIPCPGNRALDFEPHTHQAAS